MSIVKSLKIEEVIKLAIEQSIKNEVDKLMLVAIENVKTELTRRLPEVIAGVTIDITRMIDFQELNDRVVFSIRKEKSK